jgi:alpha-tubulin suppressor-like RCC1 family protein
VGTVAAIAAGANQSVALRPVTPALNPPAYSALLCGDNTWGQLGSGTLASPQSSMTAVALSGTPAPTWRTVAAGGFHTLAIRSDGTLWAWGNNAAGQLGQGNQISVNGPTAVGTDTDWFAVSAGGSHSLAIKLDRTLWSWGANTDGQLGDGSTTGSSVPIQVGTNTTWVAVAAGRSHSLAIDIQGRLWVWGRNAEGQLGSAAGSAVPSPTLLA